MEGIQVDLTEFEYRVAKNLAKARFDSAEAKYKDPAIHTARADMGYNHLLGAISEVAVCKHFNVYPEISGGQENTAFDCIVKGKRVDIKASDFHKAKLLVQVDCAKHNADIYILAVVAGSSVWIKGYALRSDIIQPEMITEPIKGKPAYTMQQNHPKFNKM